MAHDGPKTTSSGATVEVLDPYGLLESDGEQDTSIVEYNEPYYMLSEKGTSQYHSSEEEIASRELTAQEQWLGDRWSSLLNLDHTSVKPEDSFFDLGATSVEALRLGAATQDDGLFLPVPDVFRNPTLSDMAKAIRLQSEKVEDRDRETAAFSLVAGQGSIDGLRAEVERQCTISLEMIEDVYPCTPLQKGMMALSMLKPGVYIEQHVYTIPESWDATAFQTAWHTVAVSNPILRTRIVQTEECG